MISVPIRFMDNSAESVTGRVRALRMRAGLNMDEFARSLGYSRASSIQRYENPLEYKGGYLKRDLVAKMAGALAGKGEPTITPKEVWELAGPEFKPANQFDAEPRRPQKLISSYDPDAEDIDTHAYSREHWVPSVEGALPELDVKLGAGEGIVGEVISLSLGEERISGHRVVAEWLVPENYLTHEAKASGQNTIVMEVVGDSMQPSYMPGDRVLVDLLQNKMVADTVYAISDGIGEPQIKRLQRIPFSQPVRVNIISDNPVLQMFTVELAQLQIIGRVCGHIARR